MFPIQAGFSANPLGPVAGQAGGPPQIPSGFTSAPLPVNVLPNPGQAGGPQAIPAGFTAPPATAAPSGFSPAIHGFGPGGVVTGVPHPGFTPAGFGGGAAGAHHGENYSPLASFLQGAHQGETAPTDEQNAGNVVQHLMGALNNARDPNLRESLSNALAAIHKHLAGFQKERQQALAGKLSPRLLEQAHGVGHHPNAPAQLQAAGGNYAGAVQTWMNHHPAAVAQGHVPGFVQQWEAAISNAPAPGPTAQ